MIFLVSEDMTTVQGSPQAHFSDLQIWERAHIEEWVRTSPEILGEKLLVLSAEFDRFDRSSDRLDVLALDCAGNLVVIELKRDPFAGYADLQSIRYAAMVSSMTIEKLLPHFVAYRQKYEPDPSFSLEAAHQEILDFVADGEFEELSNKPRIILCSEGFSPEITTTVLWLRKFHIDIGCVRLTPYQVEERVVVVPQTIIPLQEAAEYLIDIQRKEEQAQERSSRRRATMSLLLENGLLSEGDRIHLQAGLPSFLAYSEEDPHYHAVITGKRGQSDAVRWEGDGEEYSISGLTWKIFKEFHPDKKNPPGINGNEHWTDGEGQTLWQLGQSCSVSGEA